MQADGLANLPLPARPFSALDAELRASLRKAFAQRISQPGIAAVLVTHD